MAPVRSSNRSDVACVPGGCEPVVNSGADSAALDRRLAGSMVTRDQQDHPFSARDHLLEAAVDGHPRFIESHSVEIDRAVRLDGSAAQSLVPAAVKRPLANWSALCGSDRRSPEDWRRGLCLGKLVRLFSCFDFYFGTRERSDGRGDARPQLRLLRAERAHAPQHLWARGSAPRRTPTYRRRSQPPPAPRPRRCRSGSAP